MAPMKSYEMVEDTAPKMTEFNSGIAKLMRIDRVKIEAHKSRLGFDLDMWARCLQSFESEIYERLDKDEKKYLVKLRISIAERREDWINSKTLSKIGGSPVTMDYYNLLDHYEKELNGLEKKYGFGMRDMPNVSSAATV